MALSETATVRMWNRNGSGYVDVLYILNDDGLTYSLSTTSADGEASSGLTDTQLRASGIPVILSAGELHLGEISANEGIVTVTPVITANAYHANDVIGGIMTIPGASRVAGKATNLVSLVIDDQTIQMPAMQLWFFVENPAAGTYTDHGALTIHDTDLFKCCGVINTGDGTWTQAADNAIFTMTGIGLKMVPTATSLFCIARVTGTPTFVSVGDLKFRFGFEPA